MSERLFLSPPDVTEYEHQAVSDAMRSGWIAPAGPHIDAFEHAMAQRVGVQYAVALSSGTAALHLGLLGLGVRPGHTVITSTMTFAATTNAIVYTGATPYFVDSDITTGNMDPVLLEKSLQQLSAENQQVAAIIPVDLFGKAADYSAILPIAQRYGVPVLADAAESLGAQYHGQPAGSFGQAAITSFNGNKIMTTSGGGMLFTDDVALADKARYLATQARQPVTHYEHVEVGYNYRISNLLAALGLAQLNRLTAMLQRRRAWREQYRSYFADVPGIEIFGGDDSADNCWLTSIIIDPITAPVTPQQLQRALEQANIETRPLWKPMHLQPAFVHYPGKITGTAQQLFERGLTLPSGSAMTQRQFDSVVTALDTVVHSRMRIRSVS